MTKNLMEFAQEYSGAWAAHDPGAISALHTGDSVFELHGAHAPAAGRPAVRDLIAMLVGAVPDLRFDHIRAYFGDRHFVSEYVMKGTADGKQFAISGVDVFAMRDGLVARKDSYLDWLAYQSQVGVDPVATFRALGDGHL